MEPATNFYCPDHLVSILIKTEKFSFTEMKIPPPLNWKASYAPALIKSTWI